MKLKILATALIASAFLAGCATTPKEIALHNSFDADARETAQKLLQKGNNTIKGNALIRQRGGGVVTCAGYTVNLIPVTAYASERIQALYGNTTRGFRNTLDSINFVPDSTEYWQFTKETTCDAQGDFAFRGVYDGSFYVVTTETWEVVVSRNTSYWEGGALMKRVTISGGETKEIVLAP